MMDNKINWIKDWVEELEKRGKISFSFEDVLEAFPNHNGQVLKNSLTRLTRKGKILSVWKGFYIIIPLQYYSMGILPANMFIDQLMKNLNKKYYFCLLNAAAIFGSAHQSPQTFSVMIEPPSLRSTTKKRVQINFYCRKQIPKEFLVSRNTPSGTIKVSSPELTAADLILYEKNIGGLNRAATVLSELAEEVDFKKNINPAFFEYFPLPVIQRLGYLLEEELEFESLANDLWNKIQKCGLKLRTVPLRNRKSVKDCPINKKWKVIINTQIEID